MKNTLRRPKITVTAGGAGVVSQSGGLLLTGMLRVTGLDQGLSAALARWRAPRAVHDPALGLAWALMSHSEMADLGVLSRHGRELSKERRIGARRAIGPAGADRSR